MRKTLAITLVSLHLLANTEASQLLKLPQLIHHYFQHHRQDPSINFFQFIVMHYAGDDGTTADDDYDKQLPCHQFAHNSMTMAYSPMVGDIPEVTPPGDEAGPQHSRLLNQTGSEHVLLIIQPPRLA